MKVKTLILGAGAAGMFCAMHAGPGTLVVDHARAPGEKIRISGGGRCNFTNMHCDPSAFLSENKHFAKSALSRYTQWDFIDLVQRHGIAYHEKTLGQLFCDGSAREIVTMLRREMDRAGAQLWLETSIGEISHDGSAFTARLTRNGRDTRVEAQNLVLATGGKSIPKMGATGLAYDIARRFGLALTETRPALVPLTFPEGTHPGLPGVALPVRASAGGASFDEAMLFTHRGLSGPAILQISSYWRETERIEIDLLPGQNAAALLADARAGQGKKQAATVLAAHLPQRLTDHLTAPLDLSRRIGDLSDAAMAEIAAALHRWTLTPQGSEGYRTAEVTLGGIDTAGLSSKTMEARTQPGLFVIGEAMDVTGWLGGYNFQWAWSSAHAAATELRAR